MTVKKINPGAGAGAGERGADATQADDGHDRRRPRRAPKAEERQRDAERSRRLLLDAALDEFASRGPAGARVQEIAERAGVNKQLINYYFGGKDGLYRELHRGWAESEALFAEEDTPLAEVAVRYLERGLADPRPARLMLWRGLSDEVREVPEEEAAALDEDVAGLRRARERGEIADDLDPAFLRLAVMGMIMAPIVMPQIAGRAAGLDPRSAEFRERYGEQIRRLVRHLGGPVPEQDPPNRAEPSAT
ncbi:MULTISPECIES: TetR family transcriptional regulator [unclassified Embleya]|uniref:TetR/AcrR family transcriptional regulator n=1 Tax=unclassified Embleya TaxID=2699296 RepID=UPI0034038FDF